jgi:hypothetical protein
MQVLVDPVESIFRVVPGDWVLVFGRVSVVDVYYDDWGSLVCEGCDDPGAG